LQRFIVEARREVQIKNTSRKILVHCLTYWYKVLHFLKDKMFVLHILRDLRNC
jgi:hypothetical protein